MAWGLFRSLTSDCRLTSGLRAVLDEGIDCPALLKWDFPDSLAGLSREFFIAEPYSEVFSEGRGIATG